MDVQLILRTRLTEYDKILNTLFTFPTDFDDNKDDTKKDIEEIKATVKAIQEYYGTSYANATQYKTQKAIVDTYENYVQQLEKVTKGELKSEQVIQSINRTNNSRKINILCANLAKASEIIFWITATTALFTAIPLIVTPMFVLQPFLGIVAAALITGLLLKTIQKSIQCFNEFRAFKRHNEEYQSEVTLTNRAERLPFFKTTPIEPISDSNNDSSFNGRVSINIGGEESYTPIAQATPVRSVNNLV